MSAIWRVLGLLVLVTTVTAAPPSHSLSVRIAENYLASPDYPNRGALAQRALELAASTGDIAAQRRLGELLYRARYIPRNDAAAIAWLDKASASGDTTAGAQAGYLRMHRPDGADARRGLRSFLRFSEDPTAPGSGKRRAWEREARPARWDWAFLSLILLGLASAGLHIARRPAETSGACEPITWHELAIAAAVTLSCLALPGRYLAQAGPYLDALRVGGLEGNEILIMLLSVAVLGARPRDALAAVRQGWVAALLGGWFLIDALCRPNTVALVLAAKFQLPLLAGLALGSQGPGPRFWRPLALGLTGGLALSAAAVVGFPDAAVHQGVGFGAWNGLFWHKNNLGAASALGALALLPFVVGWAPTRHRRAMYAALGLTGVLLVASRSRGAQLALSAGLTVAAVAHFASRRERSLPTPLIAAGVAAVLCVAVGWAAAGPNLGTALGRTRPMGGRMQIFRAGARALSAAPIRGYGIGNPAGGYLRPAAQATAQSHLNQAFFFQSAHNFFLDLALLLGFPAAVFVALGIGYRAWRAAISPALFEHWVLAILAGFFAVAAMGETLLFRPARIEWLVIVACLAVAGPGSAEPESAPAQSPGPEGPEASPPTP